MQDFNGDNESAPVDAVNPSDTTDNAPVQGMVVTGEASDGDGSEKQDSNDGNESAPVDITPSDTTDTSSIQGMVAGEASDRSELVPIDGDETKKQGSNDGIVDPVTPSETTDTASVREIVASGDASDGDGLEIQDFNGDNESAPVDTAGTTDTSSIQGLVGIVTNSSTSNGTGNRESDTGNPPNSSNTANFGSSESASEPASGYGDLRPIGEIYSQGEIAGSSNRNSIESDVKQPEEEPLGASFDQGQAKGPKQPIRLTAVFRSSDGRVYTVDELNACNSKFSSEVLCGCYKDVRKLKKIVKERIALESITEVVWKFLSEHKFAFSARQIYERYNHKLPEVASIRVIANCCNIMASKGTIKILTRGDRDYFYVPREGIFPKVGPTEWSIDEIAKYVLSKELRVAMSAKEIFLEGIRKWASGTSVYDVRKVLDELVETEPDIVKDSSRSPFLYYIDDETHPGYGKNNRQIVLEILSANIGVPMTASEWYEEGKPCWSPKTTFYSVRKILDELEQAEEKLCRCRVYRGVIYKMLL